MIYDMQYRDGANYKQWFRAEINIPKEIGDEVYMEDSGMDIGAFWRHMGWPSYDPTYDHNILEVIGISEDQVNEPEVTFKLEE